jgi:hypothetical protein
LAVGSNGSSHRDVATDTRVGIGGNFTVTGQNHLLSANSNIGVITRIGVRRDATLLKREPTQTLYDVTTGINRTADHDVATACLTLINRGTDHTVAAQVDFLRGNANVASVSFS